jgi:hypothetical protein
VDYAVKTPLSFDAASGDLTSARLQVQVEVEVQQQQQQQQLRVTVDLCLADGTPLLQDIPTTLTQVCVRLGRQLKMGGRGG